MLMKFRLGWVIGLACITAVACGDDESGGGNAGGEAGNSAAGESGSVTGGTSGHAGSAVSGGAAGEAGAEQVGGTAHGGDGGASGEATTAGQGGLTAAGAPSGDAGQAGAGGVSNDNVVGHSVCPDTVGATFKACRGCFGDDNQLAWAAAFGCDIKKNDLLTFTVKRFQVDATRIDEMYRPYQGAHTGDYYRFAITSDCQPNGLEPVTYTQYPNTLTQPLEPGIYTEVICAADDQVVHDHYPPPMMDTNVDCAHATPLLDGGEVPGGDVVGGGARYFSFSLNDTYYSVDLTIDTAQTNEDGYVSLTGPKTATSGDPRPLLPLPFTFLSLPAGDYCAQVNVTGDVAFSIAMALKK